MQSQYITNAQKSISEFGKKKKDESNLVLADSHLSNGCCGVYNEDYIILLMLKIYY